MDSCHGGGCSPASRAVRSWRIRASSCSRLAGCGDLSCLQPRAERALLPVGGEEEFNPSRLGEFYLASASSYPTI